ncbi:MAG: Dam family site-specific DNA-(adenine-N6)-methyltransferase [Gammaproteobacteria bacterium]
MAKTNLNSAVRPVRPFLKWAGNKYQILHRIQQHLPAGKRLIEPFVGSGALFLNSDYGRCLLADSNPDLINLYNLLKKEGPDFIHYCQSLFEDEHNNPDSYYDYRLEFNSTDDVRRKSALFIYLNRHGYNGLCRYNKKGGFNVPFGRYKKPYFPATEMLHFHHKAKRAVFKQQDFEKIMASAQQGDVIYCDPPYVPLSASANFTAYSAGGFDLQQQHRLVELAEQCQRRGIPVLISNHNTQLTRKIYKTASSHKFFAVPRFISCNGERRHHADEVLAVFA